jgi:hypothetical protein
MDKVYNLLSDIAENKELKDALVYYQQNPISVFPYNFIKDYENLDFQLNNEDGFPYLLWENKKIFFKQHWSDLHIIRYFKGVIIEQDPDSPHRYLSEDFDVDKDTTVIDIGVAEGNFSLEVVDRAKRVLIFENDPGWVQALEKTFFSYSDRVEIHKKRVGELTSDSSLALDDMHELFTEKIFVKIDVDGEERKVLAGMKDLLLKNQHIKVAICTYHNQGDASEFEAFFKDIGFQTSFSKGYMLFYFQKEKMAPPFLRRGVLRAGKIYMTC